MKRFPQVIVPVAALGWAAGCVCGTGVARTAPPPSPSEDRPPPPPPPLPPGHYHSAVPIASPPAPPPRIGQAQAEMQALAYARSHGFPGAFVKKSKWKHGAWEVKLEAPEGPGRGKAKLDIEVPPDGAIGAVKIKEHGARGRPDWDQDDD